MDIISTPVVENFQNNNSAAISSSADQNNAKKLPENDSNENSSANSSLNKMESLLVEDDDNEENDHGLGTESLRMSDSDGGDNDENISPLGRKKRRTQKIIDSDEDNENKEDEDDGKKKLKELQDHKESNSDKILSKPSKFSALIDSESEPDNETEGAVLEKINVPKAASDEEKNDGKQKTQKKKKKILEKSKKKKISQISDESDSETENKTKSKKKHKSSDLIDSDSESSNNSQNEDKHDEEKETPSQRPKKTQRASAKKAMDEMQAIQSETQRLYRETQINIPYHKPKRHTLKEFLTRRTIAKPSLSNDGPRKSLKMTPEELEEYAKHLEERAKEATEFFKSESDDELKDVDEQEPSENNPIEETIETSVIEQTKNTDDPQTVTTEEVDEILKEHEFISEPSTQNILKDLQVESELLVIPSTSSNSTTEESKPSSSCAKPSPLAELKRRLIAEKNIPLVPKLKGDANMMIDFETGDMFARKPTGVESLFQRFIKSNKNNKKKPEEITASQELQTTLKVAVIQEPNKEKEPKPGAAYIKLKENLRTLITRKRKQEFQKKVEETKEEEDEYNKCCGLDDDEEDDEKADEDEKRTMKQKKKEYEIMIDDEENEIDLEECNENDEDEDQDLELDEDEIKNKDHTTKEAEDDENQVDDNDEDEEESSSSSEEEQDNNEDQSIRKHRIIKAFQDSDDEETNLGLTEPTTSVLYAAEQKKNPEEVEDELLGLCSGQFTETQAATVISQIPITQTHANFPETQLEDLCSGVFNDESAKITETQIAHTQVEEPQKAVLRIESSSDEEKEPEETSKLEGKKIKKLKKKKKKHMKLGFSDDEDDDEQDEEEDENVNQEEVEEEEIPQTFIDYDSEENEIEVQMSKKDCFKQAHNFLEKEAELSESEWGSADEDERNLDKYDQELGDEDEFDQQKLHSELEQIHMRKVLDDDIREVKKIQEMLFDDEEADGVGRERKFRWKNIESGFSLDDPAGGGADNDDEVDSADDEEEMKWRKMRFEREQFLMQKSKEEIIADVSTTEIGKKLLETMEPALRDPNFKIEKKEVVLKDYKKPSFLIKQNDLSNLRDSVLNYDKEVLEKIADSITKSGDYDGNDDEGHQKKASKTGNFVFRVLTEEEQEMRKRKAEEAKNENPPKKMKTSTKSLLLDRLL